MRQRFLTLLVAVMAVTLAACSSSGSGGGKSTSGQNANSANSPKGNPLVIGTVCDCSGSNKASLGWTTDVMSAWEKSTNAAGGINGHPVKVIVKDDAGNAARGLAAVKELVNQDKVLAIVGYNSVTSPIWATWVTDKGVPVVGGAPTETAWFTNPLFFQSGASLPMMLYGTIDLAAKAGKKKLGLMYCSESPVCAQTVPIAGAITKMLGLTVASQKVSTTAPNYTAPCLSLKDAGADALWVAMVANAVPRVMTGCAQQGYKPFSTTSAATTDASWLKIAALNGTVISGSNAVYTDDSIPGIKAFDKAMQQYYPSDLKSANFSGPALYPWVGAELFKDAAEAAKLTPTSKPADVITGLYSLKNDTLDGTAPPLNFTKGKPGFTPCYFPAKIDNGKFVTTDNNQPVCLSAVKAQQLLASLGG